VAVVVFQFSLLSTSRNKELNVHWNLEIELRTSLVRRSLEEDLPKSNAIGEEELDAPVTTGLKNNTASDNPQSAQKVRFLYGIMTYDHKLEMKRRVAIRKTYLSFYQDFTDTPNRICALVDLIESDPESPLREECQLAYTFVMGGNPGGPTELLQFNESYPTIIVNDHPFQSSERDITFLNIQENAEYGKSPTWFKYGLTVMKKYTICTLTILSRRTVTPPWALLGSLI
jgi:hypothetical protein